MEILLIKGAKFVESSMKSQGFGSDLDAGERMQHERVRAPSHAAPPFLSTFPPLPQLTLPIGCPWYTRRVQQSYRPHTVQVWKDAPVRVRTPARSEQEPDISDPDEESDTDANEADIIGTCPRCVVWQHVSPVDLVRRAGG
jgi:hypothetical protein